MAGYITNQHHQPPCPHPGLFHSSMSVPTTPMVPFHGSILDGRSHFAVSLAQLSDLSDGGLSMQGACGPCKEGGINQGPPQLCAEMQAKMSLNMGIVSPVSVPFDWHNRMPPSSQSSQPMVSIMHSASSQAGMIPQTPTLQQSSMLMHQQQVFRNAQQPILQADTRSPTHPLLARVQNCPPIAEQLPQQLHSHVLINPNLTRMGSSTPPTPQQAQPPPAFYQPQQPQTQPSQALAAPQASQAQAIPSQAPPAQASV